MSEVFPFADVSYLVYSRFL